MISCIANAYARPDCACAAGECAVLKASPIVNHALRKTGRNTSQQDEEPHAIRKQGDTRVTLRLAGMPESVEWPSTMTYYTLPPSTFGTGLIHPLRANRHGARRTCRIVRATPDRKSQALVWVQILRPGGRFAALRGRVRGGWWGGSFVAPLKLDIAEVIFDALLNFPRQL